MSSSNPTAQSGIYQIRCLVNGKVYIGSAVNIRNRFRGHRNALDRCEHHSIRLQRAWQKYGAHQFVFEVLAIVAEKENLIPIEQEWIDRVRPFEPAIGYNINPKAGSRLGAKVRPEVIARIKLNRKPLTPEARAKLSAAQKGKTLSPETRAKMSEVHRGRRPAPQTIAAAIAFHTGRKRSAETRAKLSESHKDPSAETRARIGAASKGRKLTTEHRAKISSAGIGKHSGPRPPRSPETRAKIAATMKGRRFSAETCAKISAAKMGHEVTPETSAKIVATRRSRGNLGRKRRTAKEQKTFPFLE